MLARPIQSNELDVVRLQGMCAEKCVADFGFTRKELDDFAILSYTRAAAAWKVCAHCICCAASTPRVASCEQAGKFADEVVPVEVKAGKTTTTVAEDEEFKKAKLDKIPTLKPAFKPDGVSNSCLCWFALTTMWDVCAGTITAANASSLNDGAAALVRFVLCSFAR